jgi:hypothetical protein
MDVVMLGLWALFVMAIAGLVRVCESLGARP